VAAVTVGVPGKTDIGFSGLFTGASVSIKKLTNRKRLCCKGFARAGWGSNHGPQNVVVALDGGGERGPAWERR
jgi:hypothetical protein